MTPEQMPVQRAPERVRARSAPGAVPSNAVVVIGQASDVPRAIEHPAMSGRFNVVSVVTVSDNDEAVREHAEALHAQLARHRAGIVMVAGPLGVETMRAVGDLALLHGCRLLAVMPSEVVAGQRPQVVWEGDAPLVQLAANTSSGLQRVAKRALDVVGAGLGLIVLSPVMLLMAVAIRLESRGPALFKHWRVGRDGRRFACLKFRTMQADAEAVLARDAELKALYREHNYKLPEEMDPRVTRLGKLLRRSSLDELPQLWNVLVGEMSLVGPRPVVEEELEHYRGSERLLLSVRPGMTGAWAVNGRHHVGYPARSEMELRYVRGWSLGSDLGILVGTVSAVLDPGSDL
jgi:lipopolysaccharide/colanic/teichoic acid biosynthesis glycosyltransferase